MMRARSLWHAALLMMCMPVGASLSVEAAPPQLTFEQRVAAQRAIERVYYGHQTDATLPFEAVVPDNLIERKVREYLQQSAALAQQWGEPITAPMLGEEARRIARSTRMPDRLREIFAALDHDPVLVLECLVRPALASRLTRARFAADRSLHAGAREEAAALHARLLDGSLSLDDEDPRRTVIDSSASALEPSVLREHRMRAPRRARQVGDVVERDDAFEIGVVLEEARERTRLALYTVGKRSWDDWWRQAAPTFDVSRVKTVASASHVLPQPRWTQVSAVSDASAPTAGCPINDTWDTGGMLGEDTRLVSHSMVWTGSRVIVWGGFTVTGQVMNTGVQYDPVTDTSTPTTTVDAPSARGGHSAVWTGTRMIVWGGGDSGGSLATGGSYDPIGDTWSAVATTDAPSARDWLSAVWTGTHMVIWGGQSAAGYENTGARYNPSTNSWSTTTTTDAPTARSQHSTVWTGTRMIVWGGRDGSPGGWMSTGGRYDPVDDVWTATDTINAPSARYGHTAVWNGSRMIIWGGSAGSPLSTGAVYNATLDVWTPMPLANAPSPRADHTAVAGPEGSMIVWGGLASSNPIGTGGRFDPSSNTWSPIATAGAPTARSSHRAVWTGSRMIVWGGRGPGGGLYSRYDPAADLWVNSPYTPRNMGPGRGIWTGSLMIIGFGVPALPLERYDPALDSWTPASTANAPLPDLNLPGSGPAVWTGQWVIVSGRKYDPIGDTWSAISTVNAPRGGIALWTGSEMILWGGGPDNAGGRYNPVTDSWIPISMVDAPPAGPLQNRFTYAGVWSGSRMIVWGAQGQYGAGAPFGTPIINAGGQYDPGSDTWYPVSTTNRPPPSRGYTAVWAGGRMVVWGGYYLACFHSPTDPFPRCTSSFRGYWASSGGSYDPGSDTWSPFNGNPGREEMSAMSTGSEALFWGGVNCMDVATGCSVFGGSPRQDGFRYDPQAGTVTQLSTINAPSPRARSAAVWTGREMIVWGGVSYTPIAHAVFDGGRYGIGPPPGSDADGDGFDSSCDCDEAAPTVHPEAPQLCDGFNNDCTHASWPALTGTNEQDDDGDTYTKCAGDCNDGSAALHPGAPEVCDGLDNDCDGGVDGFATTCGVGGCAATGSCTAGVDSCQAGVPAAVDQTCDGADDDCDGSTDEDTVPSIAVVMTPDVLWPPNHRMVPVHATITVDACPTSGPAPSVALIAVTSSEPDEAAGGSDGNTVNDIQNADVGGADFDLELRAERDKTGSGRVYSLTYAVTDANGHVASAVGRVFVPSDQNPLSRSPARR